MATKVADAESQSGHIAHTKQAEAKGLPGKILRPIKVVQIGAGSGFTPTITRDIFQIPGNAGGTIALVDIDPHRLDTMRQVVTRMASQIKEDTGIEWKVEASTNRLDVLAGADYIVNSIEVSGVSCVRWDNDIPAKYGVHQCIGDTIGPGGLFKALRTVPVFLQILKDAERLCPNVIVLNYTNPMSIMCLAAGRTTKLPIVGLCHSVQGTSHLLAKRAGVPYEELEWECAGVNHLAWFTALKHKGKDVYPLLFEKAAQDIAGKPSDPDDAGDLVRKDMMLHFGAFITESSGHLSEYLPYYRKRQDLIDKYCRSGYEGQTSFYADNWPTWRKNADEQRMRLVHGEEDVKWDRSWEYGSWIIEAREKDVPYRIYGNVMNNVDGAGQVITNLPADGVVEVATLIDRNGINPTRYGKLPAQMAAICASNMAMFDLAATACIEKSKEAAIYSLQLDPLTSAVASPAEIKAMTLELFDAEAEFLPGFK
ncbi:MAG: alpha-glucosidase/alpha-galactosidase [Capsulimonadaceae bacterium]|nr:alpha-glucosidase/alpha-galactosidase [Capsulimonadaceae bacterium]